MFSATKDFLRSACTLGPILITLLMSPAQAEEIPQRICTEVLQAPPFVDVLTRNDGRDWGDVRTRRDGMLLHGLACTKEELDAFFEAGGWIAAGETKEDGVRGPVGPIHSRHYYDNIFGYTKCREKPLWAYFDPFWLRCPNGIQVRMLEGKIAHILGGGKK